VAKEPHTVSLHDIATKRWLAWDVRVETTRPLNGEPAEAEVATWLIDPAMWRLPRVDVREGGPSDLKLYRRLDDALLETISTPSSVSVEGMTSDDRYVLVKRHGRPDGAVFDLQTRRWLGRWDVSRHTGTGYVDTVTLVADRWIAAVVSDQPVKVIVFDLHDFTGAAK
jgi:hypothetical protein